jgi:hypothetical protein
MNATRITTKCRVLLTEEKVKLLSRHKLRHCVAILSASGCFRPIVNNYLFLAGIFQSLISGHRRNGVQVCAHAQNPYEDCPCGDYVYGFALSVYAFDCLLGGMKRGASFYIYRIFTMNDLAGLSTILSMHQCKAAR